MYILRENLLHQVNEPERIESLRHMYESGAQTPYKLSMCSEWVNLTPALWQLHFRNW